MATETKHTPGPLRRLQRGADTIVCPLHPGSKSHVTDSRGTRFRGLPAILRRRRCRKCGQRWTTYEISSASLERLADCTNQALHSIIDTAKAAMKVETGK